MREYYNYTIKDSIKYNSFASVLSGIIKEDSIYYLKYNTDSKGYYDALNNSNKIIINKL